MTSQWIILILSPLVSIKKKDIHYFQISSSLTLSWLILFFFSKFSKCYTDCRFRAISAKTIHFSTIWKINIFWKRIKFCMVRKTTENNNNLIGAAVNAKKINVAGFSRKKFKIFRFECNFFRKKVIFKCQKLFRKYEFNYEQQIQQRKWDLAAKMGSRLHFTVRTFCLKLWIVRPYLAKTILLKTVEKCIFWILIKFCTINIKNT